MLNYIRSELYRTFHRKYTYIILFAAAAAALLVNILMALLQNTSIVADKVTGSEMLPLCMGPACVFSYFAICILTDCVFSDEYKNQTLKNTISFGLTRSTIYIGKLVVEFLLALLEVIAIFGVFSVSCFVFLGTGSPENFLEALRLFGLKLTQAFPIWLAGLAIANVFYFATRGSACVLGYLGVTLILPTIVVEYLSRAYVWAANLVPYLMFTHIGTLPTSPSFQLGTPWIMGLIWTVAALLAGYLLFRRKEIK